MNSTTISYLVLVKQETQVKEVLDQITNTMRADDELVVLRDISNDSADPLATVAVHQILMNYPQAKVVEHKLEYSFSEHRNYALPYLTKDWVMALDADETLAEYLAADIRAVVELVPGASLVWLPRINILTNVSAEQKAKFGDVLKLNNDGSGTLCIGPDYQTRLFKNHAGAGWKGQLHERLVTDTNFIRMEPVPELSIIHKKTAATHIATNEAYLQKYSKQENAGEDTTTQLTK